MGGWSDRLGRHLRDIAITLALAGVIPAGAARADESGDETAAAPQQAEAPETLSLHGQITTVTQYHPPFTAPYSGPQSLAPGHRGDKSIDATLFAGIRLWPGIEAYADPGFDQGSGPGTTFGVAGFPSGEAYKAGPCLRLPRAFVRFTLGLGGTVETVAPDQNQLGGTRMSDNVVVTLGKFAVTDMLDANTYAHDPSADFLNLAIIDDGAFDYAANVAGYTYGGAAEWTRDWWTLRAGLFDLSRVPGGAELDRGFEQFEMVVEAEERHQLAGGPGKVKLLVYDNRGEMADYNDAVRAALGTGLAPDVSAVRRYASRPGIGLNFEQQLADDLGIFARASLNDGHKEEYEFTDIDRSVAGGVSLKGARWGRPDDTVGLAAAVNFLSHDARAYFAAGGLGITIGDGQLKDYGSEDILETYYNAALTGWLALAADYQYVANPAYNRDRGPVSIFALRLHAQF